MFYDFANGDYITKISDGYARYKKPPLVKPFIVNGVNIVGICEKGDKLGTIDIGNKKMFTRNGMRFRWSLK